MRISRYAADRGHLYSTHTCFCGSKFRMQRHHKFKQTAWARKLYGDLLDLPINIQWVCGNCGPGHAGKHLIHWDEVTFCAHLDIKPRSEEARRRKQRELST